VIVLTDNDGVRATMTAAWLVQMGHDEVYVHAADAQAASLRGSVPPELLHGAALHADSVTPAELKTLIDAGSVQVVDFATSLQFREGHIPGAWHAVRSRLPDNLNKIPAAPLLVFTAAEETLARLAASDALKLVASPVKVLAGGNAAWRNAGFVPETGDARMTGAADDLSYRALDRKDNVEKAMLEYLNWEVELVNAVAIDPDFHFRRYPLQV
jgi:rhodanese-related sulfurtransferase